MTTSKKEKPKKTLRKNEYKSLVATQSKYDPQFAVDLIEHMESGKSFGSFIAYLYKKYDYMVSRATIYNWLDKHEDFKFAYDCGQALGLEYHEILMINAQRGTVPKELMERGSTKIDFNAVRFALMTRFNKDYYEKQQVDVTSSDNSLGVHDKLIELIAKRTKDE